MDHRLEHLGCSDHRTTSGDATTDDFFLQVRKFLDGKLRAEITASNHYCIGDFHDGRQVLNCGASLNFRDDHRAARCRFCSDSSNIVSRTNERERNHVDTNFDKSVEETKILWSWCRYAKPVRRNMNTWTTSQVSAVVDPNAEMVSLSSERHHLHGAIAEDQLITFMNVGQ